MKCLLQISFAAMVAMSSPGLADDAADGPRTGYFRKSVTPLELLGEQGARAISGVFAPDQKLTWQLSVPKTYNPAKPAGAIVFVGPRSWGGGKREWVKVLEEKNIVWIGLIAAGDKKPLNERMLKAILAQAVLAQDYKIDAERYYASGLAGGAHIAAMLVTTRPETFKGALFMGGALFWGDKAPPKIDLIRQSRFVFITGSNDVAKTVVQRTANAYKSAGVNNISLVVVQNMRQEMPNSTYFEAAIDYLDNNSETD